MHRVGTKSVLTLPGLTHAWAVMSLDKGSVMVSIKRVCAVFLLMVMALSVSACKGKDKGEDMLLQAENVCLFSAMEGTLTFQGKPVVGAEVVRTIEFNDKKEKPDSVVTDENGMFTFPVMNRVVRQIFPFENGTVQSLFVHYKGHEYHIWHMARGDGSEYEEFGGKPVNLRCEITNEIVPIEIKRGLLVTSCIWDSIDAGYLK